jgi:hypothetical protein
MGIASLHPSYDTGFVGWVEPFAKPIKAETHLHRRMMDIASLHPSYDTSADLRTVQTEQSFGIAVTYLLAIVLG